MHFRPHLVTTLSHVLNKKTVMSWRVCKTLKHLDHRLTELCDKNCKSAFPRSLLLRLPSLESISGSPHETDAFETLTWEIDENATCNIKSISLDCISYLPSWISALINTSPGLKTLELKFFLHGLHRGMDEITNLFEAMVVRAPTLEKLRLEQDMYQLLERNEYFYDARRSLLPLFPLTHFLNLTSLHLSMIFIFGPSRYLLYFAHYYNGIVTLQESLKSKNFEFLREVLATILPPNLEYLSILRHVSEVLTPLLMNVEHVLLVAPSRFRRLKAISMEVQYGSIERDQKEGRSRVGLGQYESPEAITELELRGQRQGIKVTWDDDWSRDNLLVR